VPARLAPNPLGHVGPLTVGTALARYCDLLSPPRRPSLAALAAFANSAVEAKELRRLAGKEGKEVLAKWFKDGISLVEVCWSTALGFSFSPAGLQTLTVDAHSLLAVSFVRSTSNVQPIQSNPLA
jgi:hypothetical protein